MFDPSRRRLDRHADERRQSSLLPMQENRGRGGPPPGVSFGTPLARRRPRHPTRAGRGDLPLLLRGADLVRAARPTTGAGALTWTRPNANSTRTASRVAGSAAENRSRPVAIRATSSTGTELR